ncbi:MAG: glycosyltransferase [Candidatus Berkelbacteria bacterium]|nr:glycosyltransferase [Candidatus Berkelbacteria bacterium]
MKILFVSDSYIPVPNGTAVSVETLRLSLEKLGHTVYVIAPKYRFWKHSERGIARLPGLFKPFEKYNLSFWPTVGLNLKKLKDFGIDIVHSHFYFRPFYYAKELASSLDVPLVNTNYRIFPEVEKYKDSLKIVKARRVKKALVEMIDYSNACDQIVALSKSSKNYLNDFDITTPIKVVPVGVFIKDYISYPPEAIRNKFKIPHERKLVLYVGAIENENEITFLIRAFRSAWKAIDDVHLLIIGSGTKLPDFQKAVAKLPLNKFTTFTGYLPKKQVNKIYAIADVLAYPGRIDPQPLVIAESLASGTPVVAVKGMGAQDFISDSQDGFVTDANLENFSGKLTEVLKKDKMRLDFSLKARINARKFRASILTRELVDLYASAVSQYKNKIV